MLRKEGKSRYSTRRVIKKKRKVMNGKTKLMKKVRTYNSKPTNSAYNPLMKDTSMG